jgi:subtilase family protein
VRLSRLSPLACLALALAVLPARADAARSLPQPPMRLPHAASAATSGPATWVVGARQGSAAIAARFGARLMSDHGAYVVSRDRASALAAALRARNLLVYAEPNGRLRRKTARDPLSDTAGWRDYIVDPAQQEPGIGPLSPQLALIDTPVEFNHGEFTNSNVTSTDTEAPVFDEHGTATAAVAAAPVNGIGIVGVWPGMRTLNIASPETFTCADSAKAIDRAIQLKVATINMSYGSPNLCFAEYVELQFAVSRGIVVVAAAGNEFNAGNPLEFPASLPHVLTVAAVGADLRPAFFSNANAAVDLSAPGLGVLTAVPARFDDDGPVDGYARLSGTSFSAPMVAAAATWVRAARPTLTWDQVAQVVRLSANDIGAKGWDSATGFGLLDVDAALREAAPPPDPFEANDDIVWVNGKVFGEPDPAVFRGGKRVTFNAFLDQFEDPADVYRVRLPGRSRIRIEVVPHFGDPDLAVFNRKAQSTSQRSRRVARSHRNGTKTERVTVINRSRSARTYYVQAIVDPSAAGLDAGYKAVFRRLKFRPR